MAAAAERKRLEAEAAANAEAAKQAALAQIQKEEDETTNSFVAQQLAKAKAQALAAAAGTAEVQEPQFQQEMEHQLALQEQHMAEQNKLDAEEALAFMSQESQESDAGSMSITTPQKTLTAEEVGAWVAVIWWGGLYLAHSIAWCMGLVVGWAVVGWDMPFMCGQCFSCVYCSLNQSGIELIFGTTVTPVLQCK